ncbi:RHS repeat-associated core domain-containing protein [Dyella choica]|uniref:RHS repeat protein n=1 Tax=Dyella choica TaxID=1927959 RepID=A0A432M542_9GAMM|nr:RHS repeat-associated core domain-containing protein [Dyella choica]RUL74071.1 RHS repeat protein [Dyella choica]
MKQGQAVNGSAGVIAITNTVLGKATEIGARMMMIRKPLAGLALGMAMAIVAAPVAAQTANTKTIYTYDALDRLTQVTDPSGLNTTYQYDGLSDETKLTSPDTGITAKTYDAAGNVLTALDANGNTVTYTYDAQDRRLSASYADSTQNIAYTYDEPGTVTGCTTSYPIGHLTRVVENAVTTVFCYNAQGYVIQKSQTVSGHTDVTSYSRSPGGKILSITHPSGNQVSYSYDADGRISSVTAATSSGTTTLVSNATYLPFGPISGYTLGNGQAITRTYDANYRMTDLASPAFTLHVARDAMGDITGIGNSPGANPATEAYSYDPLYRLTSITEANGSTLESVTYNQTGDRLSKTGGGLATGTYSYNPSTHQLIATDNAARSVDANGNTTAISQAGSTYGFGYNDRNRMVVTQLNQSTVAAYTYNAHGERVAKISSNSTERYNYGPGGQLLSEYGATNREYVYFDGLPVANIDTNGTFTSIAYVSADHSGTPRVVTDGRGTTLWTWPYQGNQWGELQPTSNSYTYNLRFPGQYYDVESGLSYNLHRDYDSATGRYIESDPKGLQAGVSTFLYASGNPLTYVDPLGLQDNNTVDAYCVRYGAEACADAVGNGQTAASGGSKAAGAIGGAALGAAAAGLTGDSKQCPDDDCAALIAQINAHVALMEEVYDDMLIDEHDLYHKAFDTKLPGEAAYWGTWTGHVNRYEGLRKGLQAMIAKAEARGCTVPPKAYQMASSPAPAWPVSSYD